MAAKKKTGKKTKTTKKKTGKKSTRKKTTTAVLSSESPCRKRGPEAVGPVFVRPTQHVQAFLQVCTAAADVRVSLHQQSAPVPGGSLLFSGRLPPSPNPLVITLPPLPVGRHLVSWAYAVAGVWDVVAEVHVDGVALFRKLNTHEDGIPVTMIWAHLEVTQ